MTRIYKRLFLVGFVGLLLTASVLSCGNRKHEYNDYKVKNKSDKELEAALESQDSIGFNYFSVRIGIDILSKTQNTSFSAYLKLNVDSAFGGYIKKTIIIATYMVTEDSVIFVNKFEDCYFKESLDYISVLFGTELEFDFLQDLILGKPIGFEKEENYKQINAKDHYILSSHKKRAFKKLEQDKLDVEDDLMLIQYHMSGESLLVDKIDIEIPSDTATIEVNYVARKLEEGFSVPEETIINIFSAKDTVRIGMNYAPVKLNDPKEISINIPDTYIECP
ncbi:DUF4292 domain-containing protein [Crocinitomix sp.]|nr:DUF4292 domain-containing protein [Crocinitomix sp.]